MQLVLSKNAASLLKGKHRGLTCARSAHELNNFQSSHFVQLLHFKESLFSAAEIARLKNTSSLLTANSLIVCRFSASLPKRRNATTSKVHTLFSCCILRCVYFKRHKWCRLKTRRVCLTQTSRIDVCAFRALMQQSSRIDILSTVAF